MEKYVNIRQAAMRLGVTQRQLRRAAQVGIIPAYNFLGRTIFLEDDVIRADPAEIRRVRIRSNPARVPSGYMTVQEAARKLGISSLLLSRYVKTGNVPAQRIGRRWYVAEADLESMISPGLPETGRKVRSRARVGF